MNMSLIQGSISLYFILIYFLSPLCSWARFSAGKGLEEPCIIVQLIKVAFRCPLQYVAGDVSLSENLLRITKEDGFNHDGKYVVS